MVTKLFNPFDRFSFSEKICFLTGESAIEKASVFPAWLTDRFNLAEKPIKLLDESIQTYADIKVPCSGRALEAIAALDEKIVRAFEAGYTEVSQLDQISLFQWIGKLVYGMIHFEIRSGIRQQVAVGEDLNFSQSLIHRFGSFQMMLQSLVHPTEFEGILPWSIQVFPVNNAPETFSFRDEINTLTFSLRMQDFGIVACLQDNGANQDYHKDLLAQIKGQPLHPIQFEEVCARFFYSSYLFNRLPEYTFLPTPEMVYVESMPFYTISGRPLFDPWQNKTYGQVLENFWKPWGFILFEIIKNPEQPLSFLTDESGEVRPADKVALPL